MSKNQSQQEGQASYLIIGQVTKPHGVRGEVRVIPHTDDPERFTWLEKVYLDEALTRATAVEQARLHKDFVLLKLAGYDDRDAAEGLRGHWLYISEADALPLAEDEYYLYELEGMAVVTVDGRSLGVLVEVIETRANNVFVVKGPLGELLIPDIEDVIQTIDFEENRMTIIPMQGLLPE